MDDATFQTQERTWNERSVGDCLRASTGTPADAPACSISPGAATRNFEIVRELRMRELNRAPRPARPPTPPPAQSALAHEKTTQISFCVSDAGFVEVSAGRRPRTALAACCTSPGAASAVSYA